jgi:iron(III) transport system permease protein
LAFNGWTALHTISCLCVVLPFLALSAGFFSPASQYWEYVREHILSDYLKETLVLTAASGITAWVLGVALAWAISMNDFPGKKIFELSLILPLAIPPYIAAYSYGGLFGYTGFIQTALRNAFGFSPYKMGLNLPVMAWAVFVFSLTLFPYVYLITRTFLKNQSSSLFENAILLGGGRARMFFQVGLPLLLPSSVAGAILVCLEVLNDFGVVKYYGISTFTTAIFTSWFGLGDTDTAIRLALILLSIVLLILVIRSVLQNKRKLRIVSSREKKYAPPMATGRKKSAIMLLCGLVTLFSFVLPLVQMFYWLRLTLPEALNAKLLSAIGYTVFIGLVATLAIMILVTASVNANRLFGSRFRQVISQISTIGYAIPSAVLAIGVFTAFAVADRLVIFVFASLSGLPLSMSSALILFALAVRFYTIGYQSVEAGFSKIGNVYTEASRTLGRGVTKTFFMVDMPLIRHALISGAALVFLDIAKELPLSLILRPFNRETLGTWAYHFANNEVLEETALPSLCIVLTGTIFILAMQFWEKKERKHVS